MDHGYIDQYDLVDRYLIGKLSDEESARFEDHYADCPQCFDRLKITKNFIQDLRSPAARQALQFDDYTTRRTFMSMPSSRSMAFAAGLLLVIVVTGAILSINFIQSLRTDVSQARDEAAQLRRNYEEAQKTASLLGKELEERELELAEQARTRELKPQNNQGLPDGRAAESSLWVQPKINPLIFSLRSANRGDTSRAATINEIALPGHPAGFLISMGLESDVSYTDYRVTIVDDRNADVIKRNGFKLSSSNAISIGLNSTLFQSGKYLLKVEGITKDGEAILIGNYPFHVIKNR